MIANKTLYLTADDKVVGEDHAGAAFLLVRKGCEIDSATAEKYGLKAAPAGKAKAARGESFAMIAGQIEGRFCALCADLEIEIEPVRFDVDLLSDSINEMFDKLGAAISAKQEALTIETSTETKAVEPADNKAVSTPPETKTIQSAESKREGGKTK